LILYCLKYLKYLKYPGSVINDKPNMILDIPKVHPILRGVEGVNLNSVRWIKIQNNLFLVIQ
jgi:hypothetical protein